MRFGYGLDLFNGCKVDGQGQDAGTGNHLTPAAAKVGPQGGEDNTVEAVDCQKPLGVDFYKAVAGAYNTDLALMGPFVLQREIGNGNGDSDAFACIVFMQPVRG
jgi:hypothetical protein